VLVAEHGTPTRLAVTHASKTATVAAGKGPPVGGIGESASFMRATQRSAIVPPLGDGALRSASETSAIGASIVGGLEWQLVQFARMD
jgi:hypothetical protein